jgi:hypothetical protein
MVAFSPPLVSILASNEPSDRVPHARAFMALRIVRWVGVLLVACGAGAVPAQDRSAGEVRPQVNESGPEIFYLQDDGGRLVPVPGFRYRDFIELFRMQEGLPGAVRPPAAVLESIVVRLDPSAGDAAECPISVECVVRQTRSGWVSVPLDLDGLLLSVPPRHEGPGRLVVDADPNRRGFRAWLDGSSESGGTAVHTVVLEGRVSMESAERHEVVALRLPPANVSLVEVRTPRVDPLVTVQPGSARRIDVQPLQEGVAGPRSASDSGEASDAPGGSLVSIAGLSGPVRIRIADRAAVDAAWDAMPQAAVESVVRIDGRNAFIEAAIVLENLPPDTRQVRVFLPPRARLRSVRAPATVAGRGEGGSRPFAESPFADSPFADITVERDASGRATIEVECERPIDPSSGTAFEAIGFTVAEVAAWRQWGRVSLVLEGDWRAEWGDVPALRRVDPPAAARRPGFVAAFAYDSQPASLPLRVRPKRSRVLVEPEYRYDVAATRVTLQARLRVAARGAPVTGISLDIDPAWTIDDVGPPGMVDTTAVAVDGGRVSIPFLQAIAGDGVIEVRASRSLARTAEKLSWKTPVPQADLVGPGTVIISADSDIEILPDTIASSGLMRQPAGGTPRLDADRVALVYRLDASEGLFAGTRRFLPRRVDATVSARADLEESEMSVEQTVRLQVVHVPLEYVELSVPESVTATGSLELRQGDVVLDPLESTEAVSDPSVGPSVRTVRAILATPLLGPGELTVRFRMPMPSVPPQTTVAAELPLVLPVGARIERQSVTLDVVDSLAVDVRGDAWRRDIGPDDTRRTWIAARRQESLPLAIVLRPPITTGGTIVEAAWLRSYLSANRRQDVHAMALVGAGERVTLSVPFTDGAECVVTLDGTGVPATRRLEGRLVFELPRIGAGRRRLLEIRTATAWTGRRGMATTTPAWPARVSLDPPAFDGSVTQRRFFWEVFTRADEHLLGPPHRWSLQERWRWTVAGYVREPAVQSEVLAEWIRRAASAGPGAGVVAPLVDPLLTGGRAVFSGVGPPGQATLWLVPTWCAVLVASSVSLGVGLALAYLPWLRRPRTVLPLLAVLGLAAAAWPDLAPSALQFAVPGIALSLVAWGLRGWLDRDRTGLDAAPGGPAGMPRDAASPISSLARPVPSLLVAPSSIRDGGSVTAAGRAAP